MHVEDEVDVALLGRGDGPVQHLPPGLPVGERAGVVLEEPVVERHAGDVEPVQGHGLEVARGHVARTDVAAEPLGLSGPDQLPQVADHRRLADEVEPLAPQPALPQQPAAEVHAAEPQGPIGTVQQLRARLVHEAGGHGRGRERRAAAGGRDPVIVSRYRLRSHAFGDGSAWSFV